MKGRSKIDSDSLFWIMGMFTMNNILWLTILEKDVLSPTFLALGINLIILIVLWSMS